MTQPDPHSSRHLAESACIDGLGDETLWQEVLCDPSACIHAVGILTGTLANVNAQLAAANEQETVDLQWLAKARGFRALVERRLLRAKAVEKARNVELQRRAQEGHAKDVNVLLDAIYRHRRATLDAEITPEDHDVALWEAREQIIADRKARKATAA